MCTGARGSSRPGLRREICMGAKIVFESYRGHLELDGEGAERRGGGPALAGAGGGGGARRGAGPRRARVDPFNVPHLLRAKWDDSSGPGTKTKYLTKYADVKFKN
jgi:hypothetical protein